MVFWLPGGLYINLTRVCVIISQIIPTFAAKKQIFGYLGMVYAMVSIGVLGTEASKY